MRRDAFAAAIAVAMVAAGALMGTRAKGPWATVGPGVITDRFVAEARVVSVDGTAAVSAPAEGRVLRVFVVEGDRVVAEQPLCELTKEDSEIARMTAPIAGSVLGRHVDVGDTVHAGGSPLFEIADPARIELRIEVEERDAERVELGQSVTVTPPGGSDEIATATIRRIGNRLEPRTVLGDEARARGEGWVRPIWAIFRGDSAPKLPIGRHVEAVVHIAEKEVAARVPRGAIALRDGRTVVDTRFGLWTREEPVEVLATDGAFAAISGIAPGTRVEIKRRDSLSQ